MRRQTDWLQILVECKNKVREQVSFVPRSPSQPLPDLGVGAGGDPMRQADLLAKNAIVDTFLKYVLSFTFINDESGIKEYGKTPHECFVTNDSIDGTTNFMRGIPFYATSFAVSSVFDLDTVHAALVSDLFHDITYVAQRGKRSLSKG